ncbi:MAG: S8 family serine peptidase [Ignavibacteria bacterium]|nr:S8 family serine peptidase [Ignavibacteria bacterium]
MKKIKLSAKRNVFFLIIMVFLYSSANSQSKGIIIKLKKNTPADVVNNFKNNSPKSGNSSLSKISRDLDVVSSKPVFSKANVLFSNSESYKEIGLDKIFIIQTSSSRSDQFISLAGKNEFVEYIQPVGVLRLQDISENSFLPNDPYFGTQYYLDMIGMQNVWDITRGDSNIVIGVVDTGLDFLHPDLQKSFKINYGEYGNGKESNGIDDDNNGFIDDWRGWDFTDEPFTGDPRRGDYLDPDNDPTDDNKQSHGTAVTGIINASFNNGIGISSVAPDCKVMVLRAFDAEGFGEEDDVANAVLYGISNGVRIFNFSFGDYVFSNLLRDVVKFAYTKNVIIVCSGGNDGSDRLHYPSAYDEVISVGASDETNNKASFSSYGETVDIFAPGFQNLTTVRTGKGSSAFDGNYDKLNGTSFAAPIVAGVAGLLLSKNPALTNEEVRGILVSTTTMMAGQNSWDHLRSSGRLNAISALENFSNPSVARINYPFQDFTFENDIVPVCVSAASPIFLSYSLYYGVGQRPAEWIPILQNQSSQVLNDTVARWNTAGMADTSFTLRLAINSNSGRTIEHRMIIFKDRNPPVITDIAFGTLIDKNNYSQLILFATNKRTLGKIYYKRKNVTEPFQFVLADVGTPNIGFVTQGHFGLLSGNDLAPNTEYEFYVEAISLNGKTAVVSDTAFYFYTQPQINNYGYIQKNYSLTYSQSSNTIFDYNGDGKNDILLNDIKKNLKLNIFEFNSGSFNRISNDNWSDFKVGRDIADIDGDGRLDLLLSKGRDGFVYESSAPNQLPVNLIWSDSVNGNFWSARIADTDGDGRKEILGFGRTGLRILESTGDNNFVQTANLEYFGIDSTPNSQNALVEDFDNDGKKDIAFMNVYYENRNAVLPKVGISVYENTSDNGYTRVFKDSIDRLMRGDNLTAGDFDGDGKKDFAIGVVSKDGDLLQYYSLYVYTSTSDNNYSVLDAVDIYNYKSYTETSTKAADIDNDGRDEILINTGTLFYIMKYDNSQNRLIPVFYMKDINTFNQIAFDFDANGVKEFGLNTVNDTLLFFEKDIAFTGPSTPLGLKGNSVDSNMISLSFENVAGADYYRIYKSDTTQNFVLYDSTASAQFQDVNVMNRKNYYYKVSAVDLQNPVNESLLSDYISVYCHNKSKLVSVVYENNGFLTVKLSERVSSTIPPLNSFIINNAVGHPKNIAVKSNFEYFLTFEKQFSNGDFMIRSNGLNDLYNSPVDTNSLSFSVAEVDSVKFYISKLELAGSKKLKVEFNLAVDSVSIKNTGNYTFEPFDISVVSVDIDNTDRRIVYLNLQNNAVIGATGKNYLLKAFNVYSSDGIKIVDGAGSSFGLIFNKENLDEMYVYPNPYSINTTQGYITFANTTRDASIDIYDLNGKFLINIQETNGNGGVEWNLVDKDGNKATTGIYLYRATGKNSSGQDVEEKMGKFAVVR